MRQSYGLLKGFLVFQVDSLEDTDAFVQERATECHKIGVAKEIDSVIIVTGTKYGMGATNKMKDETVKADYWDGEEESELTVVHNVGREPAHPEHMTRHSPIGGCSLL